LPAGNEPRLPLLVGGKGKERELDPVAVESFGQHRHFFVIRDPDPFFDQLYNLDMKAGPARNLVEGEPFGLALLTDGLSQHDSEIGRGGWIRFLNDTYILIMLLRLRPVKDEVECCLTK
jgi:hypothetical protein